MAKNILGAMLFSLMVAPLGAQMNRARPTTAPEGTDVEQFRESWRVLEPVTRNNLSVYPVVSNLKAQTSGFLTLDEGIASGEVRILERGQIDNTIYRSRDTRHWPPQEARYPQGSASVNELVLVNNSSRPLILLAGEVVSGGKQTRIIGADLVVPPKSEPLPLTVFCVEHGRWSEGSSFGSAKEIAHPGIRMQAQAAKSQQGVWDSVARSAAASAAPASPTMSYLDVLKAPEVKKKVDEVTSAIDSDYERELREQLRGRKAVGVVVAINGELVWSDVFPSQELFEKYWPKLLRSYVMEAEGRQFGSKSVPAPKEAQAFLLEDRGRVSVKLEAGAFRLTEIMGSNYQIDALEALGKFAESGTMVHYNKMTRLQAVGVYQPAPAPPFVR